MATPTTVVLFGATGDLSRRKLLPGLLHLFEVGMVPEIQVVGTSLEDHDRDSFVEFARESVEEFGGESDRKAWDAFSERLHFARGDAGAAGLREVVDQVESLTDEESRRLHYLSVPPCHKSV